MGSRFLAPFLKVMVKFSWNHGEDALSELKLAFGKWKRLERAEHPPFWLAQICEWGCGGQGNIYIPVLFNWPPNPMKHATAPVLQTKRQRLKSVEWLAQFFPPHFCLWTLNGSFMIADKIFPILWSLPWTLPVLSCQTTFTMFLHSTLITGEKDHF